MPAEITKTGNTFYVTDTYSKGLFHLTEYRLNSVANRFHMKVRLKKRPRCAVLSKGQQQIVFDSAEELAAEMFRFQASPAARRKLFK